MRVWFAATTAALVVGVPGLIALGNVWPSWVIVLLVVPFVLASLFTIPVRKAVAPAPATSFVRGDASGSSFANVESNAEIFIDGDAREAFLWNVVHRARRN